MIIAHASIIFMINMSDQMRNLPKPWMLRPEKLCQIKTIESVKSRSYAVDLFYYMIHVRHSGRDNIHPLKTDFHNRLDQHKAGFLSDKTLGRIITTGWSWLLDPCWST